MPSIHWKEMILKLEGYGPKKQNTVKNEFYLKTLI